MSGRVAPPPPSRHSPRLFKSLLILGLFVGVTAFGTAQDQPDGKPALPPDEPTRAAAKYRIPNRERAIFRGRQDAKGNVLPNTGIVDFAPFASERDNKDEYDAWTEVIQHAAQFTTSELEEHAARDLIRAELVKRPFRHRLDLVRFDGKLTKVRRVAATQALRDAGVTEVYEASLVPLDEPPTATVSIAFTELPSAFAKVKQAPEAEWVPVDTWASAAGYFFKLAQGETPVLVGKSVTARPADTNPVLDKALRVFKFIRDDAAMGTEEGNWEEAAAWNRVLLHARRFSPEELEANARADVTFYDLFQDVRRDHKLSLVKFVGELRSLRKMEPTATLRAAGVANAYEGWLVPLNEPGGNPISIVFTDPPEGIEPAASMQNVWVSFAGYSFKLLRYESAEHDRNDPKRQVWRKAPLLLGRAVVARPDPTGTSRVSWRSFSTVASAVVLGLIGTALALTWWFRRGDRHAKREIHARRTANPFIQ